MDKLQQQLESVLVTLREQIIQFFEQNFLEAAHSLMVQYAKLAPYTVERYSLESMIASGEGHWGKAEEILKEGIKKHPLSFDLLFNLGFVYEQKGDILEAYHLYMRARYIADTEDEKADLSECQQRLIGKMPFAVRTEGKDIVMITGAGEKQLVIRYKKEDLIKRRDLLDLVANNIDSTATSVLEIGFRDGIISKNLNLYGYDVTAVDKDKRRLLNVIALEAHDNLHQPNQKIAKFYNEPVDLEWLKRIPKFDVIVAVGDEGLDAVGIDYEQVQELVEVLLQKAQMQFLIRVSTDPSSNAIYKDDLIAVCQKHGLVPESVAVFDDSEIYVIHKHQGGHLFAIPEGGSVLASKSSVFEVDVDKCVDMYGISYVNDVHHFVEVLKQYQMDSQLTYENSVLKRYYEHFRPKNLEEALFGKRGRAPWLGRGWIGFPWYWDKSLKLAFVQEPGETRPGGNHHFGPNTDEFGVAELRRLIHLYTLIKENGYQPELFSDGYISGYLLIRGDDYRFVVSEGQHRIAAIAALGYEKIRCRFTVKEHYSRAVVWDDVKRWPQVANGVYSRNIAMKIFEQFFVIGVGREKMRL
jgi:tetratricopeptide (TPR) repeat protein